jgi:hypothetical protein
MAVSQWKLTRMEVVEVNIFKDAEAAKNQLPCSTGCGKPSAAWSALMPEHNASWSVFKPRVANRNRSPRKSRRRPLPPPPQNPNLFRTPLTLPIPWPRLPQPQHPKSDIRNPKSALPTG